LGLPSELVRRVAWLNEAKAGDRIFALGVCDEPGRVLLKNWTTASAPILERRKALIDGQALSELAQLEEIFCRFQISKDGRMTLTATHLLHLGIVAEAEPWVFVVTDGHWIQITTASYRNARLSNARTAFADLLDEDD
jgi:hypothetical protein